MAEPSGLRVSVGEILGLQPLSMCYGAASLLDEGYGDALKNS